MQPTADDLLIGICGVVTVRLLVAEGRSVISDLGLDISHWRAGKHVAES